SMLPHSNSIPALTFNRPPSPHISTLSLHDALPILSDRVRLGLHFVDHLAAPVDRHDPFVGFLNTRQQFVDAGFERSDLVAVFGEDRKSTRLNSSHLVISYAVFCLKKKKNSIDVWWT